MFCFHMQKRVIPSWLYVRVCIHMFVYAYMHVSMHICACVHMYACGGGFLP